MNVVVGRTLGIWAAVRPSLWGKVSFGLLGHCCQLLPGMGEAPEVWKDVQESPCVVNIS